MVAMRIQHPGPSEKLDDSSQLIGHAPTGAWYAAIAAMSMDGMCPPSSSSCRNESIKAFLQDRGSKFWAEHQPEKNRQFFDV